MADQVELPHSSRTLPEGAEDHGSVAGDQPITVTIYLRSNPAASPPFDVAEEALKAPGERRYLTAAEASAIFGATREDIAAVTAFATAHGLEVARINQAARSVRVTGRASSIGAAFGVELRQVSRGGAEWRSYGGAVKVPAELRDVVQAVVGLDTRPLGKSHLRRSPVEAFKPTAGHAAGSAAPAGAFYPPTVAALYDFPEQAATGQTVGVFAFNGTSTPGYSDPGTGGYDSSVLQSYFAQMTPPAPMPTITNVTVQGPGNDPGDGSDPQDSTDEVYLDLSIVGALATGADIVVYFSEFTEQGWVEAFTEATTDTTNNPSVISISYGNPEDAADSAWTAPAVQVVNTALMQAASRGVSITVAAGDDGATDGETSGVHCDFPASSPWVLSCGGTSLQASGSAISSEVVWNDLNPNPNQSNGATGGGVSTVFPVPGWQASANHITVAGGTATGRGVPDVSSVADPMTPFWVPQPGGTNGVGGTSAAAPLWASLLARCNTALGKPVGFLNPLLYSLAPCPLRDILQGNNEMPPNGPGYVAGPGWDACTGLGSPGGTALLNALSAPATSTPTPAPAPAPPAPSPAAPSPAPAPAPPAPAPEPSPTPAPAPAPSPTPTPPPTPPPAPSPAPAPAPSPTPAPGSG